MTVSPTAAGGVLAAVAGVERGDQVPPVLREPAVPWARGAGGGRGDDERAVLGGGVVRPDLLARVPGAGPRIMDYNPTRWP